MSASTPNTNWLHLQIVADLAAEQPAAAVVAGGDAGRDGELPVEVGPAVADMGADVERRSRRRPARRGRRLVLDAAARGAAEVGRHRRLREERRRRPGQEGSTHHSHDDLLLHGAAPGPAGRAGLGMRLGAAETRGVPAAPTGLRGMLRDALPIRTACDPGAPPEVRARLRLGQQALGTRTASNVRGGIQRRGQCLAPDWDRSMAGTRRDDKK